MPSSSWTPYLVTIGLVPCLTAVEPVTAQVQQLVDPLASQHYLMGSALFDVLAKQDRRLADDSDETGRIRADYGAKVQLQDKVELNLSVVVDAEAGQTSWNDDSHAEVGFNTAYASFKRLIHPSFDWEIGRMPISWNLRSERGAFVYDSRANNPLITSWDGSRAVVDIENWRIQPYFFVLNEETDNGSQSDSNNLYGIVVDWQPESEIGNQIFFTGSYNFERDPIWGTEGNYQRGEQLETWYIGSEWKLKNGWDLYGEYAGQRGERDGGVDFDGLAYSLGTVWHIPIGGDLDRSAFGIQYDSLSGESNPDRTSGKYEAFVNHHEGTMDLLLVEHERYGELSELLDGNLTAYKAFWEWVFIPRANFRAQIAAGYYEINEPQPGQADDFGTEIDASLSWDYNYYTTFKFFGGYFIAGDGFKAYNVQPGDTQANDISMLGFSTLIQF
jgi:hypothetical protein